MFTFRVAGGDGPTQRNEASAGVDSPGRASGPEACDSKFGWVSDGEVCPGRCGPRGRADPALQKMSSTVSTSWGLRAIPGVLRFVGRLSNLLEYSTVMPYSVRSRGLTDAIKLALAGRQGAESRRLRFTDGRTGAAPLDVCRPQQGSNPQIRPTKRSGALMAVHSGTPLKRVDVFLAFESH